MKHEININELQQASVVITFEKAEIDEYVHKVLLDIQKKDITPGFRKGKTPFNLIKKRYEQTSYPDAIDLAIQENLFKLLDEEKIRPWDQIKLSDEKTDENGNITLTFTFIVMPKVEDVKYSNLKLTLHKVNLTEADVRNYVETLRSNYIKLNPIDTGATAENVLDLKVVEIDESGLSIIGAEEKDYRIGFGEDALGIGSDEALLGIKNGETRKITVRTKENVAEEQSNLIISGSEVTGNSESKLISLNVTAQQVYEFYVPELDDDFAKTVNAQFNSIEDLFKYSEGVLRTFIRNKLTEQTNNMIENQLIEMNPFVLSPTIVEAVMADHKSKHDHDHDHHEHDHHDHDHDHSHEEDVDPAEFEHVLRWNMIRDAIAAKEKIFIGEERIREDATKLAQMGEEGVKRSKELLKDKKARENYAFALLTREVYDKIMQQADVENVEVTFEEFYRNVVKLGE